MQTYSSRGTSINSAKLPKVYSKVYFRPGDTILDYGCGKYTAHIRRNIDGEYLPYDPFNQNPKINENSLRKVREAMRSGKPVDVICSNVLNVIDDEEVVRKICGRIEYICTKSGGRGFITVYEGDKTGCGRPSGKDQYQRHEKLQEYVKYFKNARVYNGMIVVDGSWKEV